MLNINLENKSIYQNWTMKQLKLMENKKYQKNIINFIFKKWTGYTKEF